ncbi:MAG: desulfoferrodoxin FeS4 iron-binding domain-containing protein [Eubacteriaceae bacterium]|jgi:superoxide reductase|nr:desulfoferrodoxin FeS4 iron-binding domain-containing protein [Eubacteriaceae bacterium]
MKFYKCSVCGNIVEAISESKGHLSCCGKPMEELAANSTDAAKEKHVPVVTREGGTIVVKVGEVEHPMTAEHLIQWIAICQSGKMQRVELNAQCTPMATFAIDSIEAIEVYEYCNLHGLWKTDYEV